MDFEKSLHRLEEIVEKMEGEEVSLDETLELFEEGMNLLVELKNYLQKAETKIEKLIKDAEGKLKTDEYRELSEEMEEES